MKASNRVLQVRASTMGFSNAKLYSIFGIWVQIAPITRWLSHQKKKQLDGYIWERSNFFGHSAIMRSHM